MLQIVYKRHLVIEISIRIFRYKKHMKSDQKTLLIDIMKGDEELGLYDS